MNRRMWSVYGDGGRRRRMKTRGRLDGSKKSKDLREGM